MSLTLHVDASDTDRVWGEYAMSTHPADGGDVAALDDEGDATGFALMTNVDVGSMAGACPLWIADANGGLGGLLFEGLISQPNYLVAKNDNGSGERTLADFITASAGTIIVVFQAIDIQYNNANVYDNPGPICDSIAVIGLHLTDNAGDLKLWAFNWDGSVDKVSVDVDLLTTYVACWRHSGGNLYVSVNGGTEASVASGNTTTLGGSLVLGNYWIRNTSMYGLISEMKIWDTGDADGNLAAEIAALVSKYSGGGGGQAFPALTVAI